MSLLVNRNRFGIGLIDTTKSAFYGWGVKGATQAHLPPRTRSGHFNPRARKGRDSRVHRGRGLPLVSIHAPVKGATSAAMRLGFFRCVSIHAPARGATAFDLVKNEKAQGKNIIALRPQSIYLEK